MTKKWAKQSGSAAGACIAVDPFKSTEEMYGTAIPTGGPLFTAKYAKERAELDYGYHTNYSLARQRLQDRIVDMLVPRRVEEAAQKRSESPWLVFSAGAMGAGKTRTLHWMAESGFFPLNDFVFLDHDAVRYMLPEMWYYQQFNPDSAGRLTQQEAGFIVELATKRCISQGVSCLVDGSLRDADWYCKHIPEVREEFTGQRFAIIHVHADPMSVVERAREREKTTGRHVPEALLHEAIVQVPLSVQQLAPLVDAVVTIDNSASLPPRFDALSFPEGSRLPTNGCDLESPPWALVNDLFTKGQPTATSLIEAYADMQRKEFAIDARMC